MGQTVRLIIPCPDMLHSEINGNDYCLHPGAQGHRPYCRPDLRFQWHICPRGYPAHEYRLEGDTKMEDESEDIEEEIRAGRQATLEGY